MESELFTTLSGRNMYQIISLAAGLHKCILGWKFNKWPFNHSFDSSHFIISVFTGVDYSPGQLLVFISPVAKKLNGCPVAPFEHEHFRSRARGFSFSSPEPCRFLVTWLGNEGLWK